MHINTEKKNINFAFTKAELTINLITPTEVDKSATKEVKYHQVPRWSKQQGKGKGKGKGKENKDHSLKIKHGQINNTQDRIIRS